jgi:hypothetical protein
MLEEHQRSLEQALADVVERRRRLGLHREVATQAVAGDAATDGSQATPGDAPEPDASARSR